MLGNVKNLYNMILYSNVIKIETFAKDYKMAAVY